MFLARHRMRICCGSQTLTTRRVSAGHRFRVGRRLDHAFNEHRPGQFGRGKKEIHFLISDHPVLNLGVTGLDNSLSDFVRQAVCLPAIQLQTGLATNAVFAT